MPIPDNLGYAIDEETWQKSIDTLDEKNQTEGILNGYITCVLRTWNMMGITGRGLWNDFREEFNRWTLDTFKVANRAALKMIRIHLTAHGVWVRVGPGISYAKGLFDCLQEVTQHEWTKEEIEDHLKEQAGNFNSRRNPARDQSPTIRPSAPAARATSANPPNPQTLRTDVAKSHVGRVDQREEEATFATLDTAAEVTTSAEEVMDTATTVNSLPFVDKDREETTGEVDGAIKGPTKGDAISVDNQDAGRSIIPGKNKIDPLTTPANNTSLRRGRGQPPDPKNKPKPQASVRRSTRRKAADLQDVEDQFINAIQEGQDVSMVPMTNKERADMELSIKLRNESVITTPGSPFEQSQNKEIEGLIARGVFDFVQYDPMKHDGVRIFNSRLVNEIKGKATGTPFEKSRLVIQAYNDEGKGMILTQSPTIQRASQRIIVALAPSLSEKNISLSIRDITQAYVQSTTSLNRLILAYLPKEIKSKFPAGTIMVVRKPLYGIPEAGTHWWATYHKHHRERLEMVTSTYDPCLLVSTGKGAFGVVGMQTDDTLILGTDEFATLEEKELAEAKFSAKPKDTLSSENPLIFNGCVLTQKEGDVTVELRQKEQGKRLKLIDHNSKDFKHVYMEQRARGAYIATICQPEAAFDLSVAAQHQDPTEADVNALNKRIKWQMKNLDRGIKYVAIDLSAAKLFVFIDGSFANNKDFSSQIGYEIIFANESAENEEFEITGNLIHWSSTKSKRVTRSVLASEIYGMVGGVDMAIVIGTTIKMIMDQLGFGKIPTIVCTDSYSLYECLVKLGTTKEKRLMIDIMALRQPYERREIIEWHCATYRCNEVQYDRIMSAG
ncbi:hypothetical protein N7460_007241 [Penicillium canescens]|uniref:Reverse transcriptase Ty1/copia-type domain-containing protein n=1 Tax=Penicillium canescens TaxID=5083 RepID=A0AAD6IBQ7_PENCN|nr:hypothetical protein N7460_007241 [Penicillium canescens]